MKKLLTILMVAFLSVNIISTNSVNADDTQTESQTVNYAKDFNLRINQIGETIKDFFTRSNDKNTGSEKVEDATTVEEELREEVLVEEPTEETSPVEEIETTEENPVEEITVEENPTEEISFEEEPTSEEIPEVVEEVEEEIETVSEEEASLLKTAVMFTTTSSLDLNSCLEINDVVYNGGIPTLTVSISPSCDDIVSAEITKVNTILNDLSEPVVDEAEVGNYVANVEVAYVDNEGVESTGTLEGSFSVTKRNVIYDYKRMEYTGESQEPELIFYDTNANVVDAVADEDYLIFSGYANIPGTYLARVDLIGDFAKNNKLNCSENFEFDIHKRQVKFAGWKVEDELVINSFGVDFVWKNDENGTYMVYNGHSPLFYLTDAMEYALPDAIFYYTDENGGTVYVEDAVRDIDYFFAEVDHIDPLRHRNAGTYDVFVEFNEWSFYTGCPLAEAKFTIAPKPISLEWEKLEFEVNDIDKRPVAKLNGIVDLDLPFVTLAYTYLNEDGSVFAYAPLVYPPQKVGQYGVKAEYICYKDGYTKTCNYVLDKDYETSYVIVDNESSEVSDPIGENGARIHVGTINKSTIGGLKLVCPTVDEALNLIDSLTASDDADMNKIADALLEGTDVYLYVVVSDVDPDNAEQLVLPANKTLNDVGLVNIELYACIEGDLNKYQIHETGSYEVRVSVQLSNEVASKIKISNDRNVFVSRYHNDVVADKNTMVTVTAAGSEVDRVYELTIASNEFSDFCLYTNEKPKDAEEHEVPNTGE